MMTGERHSEFLPKTRTVAAFYEQKKDAVRLNLDWLRIFWRLVWRRKRIENGIAVIKSDFFASENGFGEIKEVQTRDDVSVAEAFVAANGLLVIAGFLMIATRDKSWRVIVFSWHRSYNFRFWNIVLRRKRRLIANNRAKKFDKHQAQPNRAQTAQISLSLDDAKNFLHL